MSSSGIFYRDRFTVATDRSFYVNANLTSAHLAQRNANYAGASSGGSAPGTSPLETQSFFMQAGTAGRMRLLRLDDEIFVSPIQAGPFTQLQNLSGWRNAPTEFQPGDPSHPLRTDPGRFSRGTLTGDPSHRAIPTHHFATPWMLNKFARASPPSVITPQSPYPLLPGVISTGPFVLDLQPDPQGNACMRLLITIEMEAEAMFHEGCSDMFVEYAAANNGWVILANANNPWTIEDWSELSVTLYSGPIQNSRNSVPRRVYITKNLLSLVYEGDRVAIIKNYSPSEPNSLEPPPHNNFNNQFGFGSVSLVAARTFRKDWNTQESVVDVADLPASKRISAYQTTRQEFLRLGPGVDSNSDSVNVSTANYRIYAHYIYPTDLLDDHLTMTVNFSQEAGRGGNPLPTNLDLSKIVASNWTSASGILSVPTVEMADPVFDAEYGVVYTDATLTWTGVTFGIAGADPVATGLAAGPSRRYYASQTTFYIATDAAIFAASGGGPVTDAIARTIVPLAAITLFFNASGGVILPLTPTPRVFGPMPTFTVQHGMFWLPSVNGIINAAITPIQPIIEGVVIPNFPVSGVPTTTAISENLVISYPLDRYGSLAITNDPLTAAEGGITSLLGVKKMQHSFSNTDHSVARTSFLVRSSDIVTPVLNSRTGVRGLLMWDPVVNSHDVPPDVVTIANPTGFILRQFTSATPGNWMFTREIPVPSINSDFSARWAPTDSQLSEFPNSPGDFLISNFQAIEIAFALENEFLIDSSSGITGAEPLTSATNHCLDWKGYPVSVGETNTDTFRLRGSVLELSRKYYRWSRMIEMVTRGQPGPVVGYVDAGGIDQSDRVNRIIADACVKLYSAVRSIMTDGAVPVWPVLSDLLREGGSVANRQPYLGFDIVYRGYHSDNVLSRPSTSTSAVPLMLTELGFTNVTATLPLPGGKTERLAMYLAGPGVGNVLANLALMTDTQIETAVASEISDVAVVSERMYQSDFERIRAAARRAVRTDAFVQDVYTTLGQLRYDRTIAEDDGGISSTPGWGGFTSRIDNEMWRWAVILDEDPDWGGPPPVGARNIAIPYSAAVAGTGIYRVVQLCNLRAFNVFNNDFPTNGSATTNANFERTEHFGDFHHHTSSYGYLLYAVTIALNYGGDLTHVFPMVGSRSLFEDVASALTDRFPFQGYTRPFLGGGGPSTNLAPGVIIPDSAYYWATPFEKANQAEPFPLLQILLDIIRSPDIDFTGGNLAAADGVLRPYPPHRQFDVAAGHSWSGGVVVPHPGTLYAEQNGEFVLAYLACYRFLEVFKKWDSAGRYLPWLAEMGLYSAVGRQSTPGLLLPSSLGSSSLGSSYIPQTAIALLTSELASSQQYKPFHFPGINAITARDLTGFLSSSQETGEVRGGFPVIRSPVLARELFARFFTAKKLIGTGKWSEKVVDSPISRNFGVSLGLTLGGNLVPMNDLSLSIISPLWANSASGANPLIRANDTMWLTSLTPDPPGPLGGFMSSGQTMEQLLNPLIVGQENDVYRTDPLSTTLLAPPSFMTQQWTRFLVLAMHIYSRLFVGGPVPPDNQTFPKEAAIVNTPTIAYPFTALHPDPATLSDWYLPQSSFFETDFYYRRSLKAPNLTPYNEMPIPDVLNAFPELPLVL